MNTTTFHIPRAAVLLCLASILGLSSAAGAGEASRSYDLSGFEGIDVSGVYELEVAVGGEYSIEISGPDKELERVEVSVENGILVLSQDESRDFFANDKGVNARITLPKLTSLEVSGVVDADITAIDAENFRVDVSGVGDVELAGKCDELEVELSGVGELDASDLRCEVVDVSLSGLGDATVHASKAANAHVSGMGEIDIHGSPAVVVKDGGMMSSINVR